MLYYSKDELNEFHARKFGRTTREVLSMLVLLGDMPIPACFVDWIDPKKYFGFDRTQYVKILAILREDIPWAGGAYLRDAPNLVEVNGLGASVYRISSAKREYYLRCELNKRFGQGHYPHSYRGAVSDAVRCLYDFLVDPPNVEIPRKAVKGNVEAVLGHVNENEWFIVECNIAKEVKFLREWVRSIAS